MSAQKQVEPTAADVIAAAAKAYEEVMNTPNGGAVFITFFDADRNTQMIPFVSPLTEDEAAGEDAEDCYYELLEAMDNGWRPVCLSVMPYAEPQIIPLRDDLSIEDEAVIWGLTDEVDDKLPQ